MDATGDGTAGILKASAGEKTTVKIGSVLTVEKSDGKGHVRCFQSWLQEKNSASCDDCCSPT